MTGKIQAVALMAAISTLFLIMPEYSAAGIYVGSAVPQPPGQISLGFGGGGDLQEQVIESEKKYNKFISVPVGVSDGIVDFFGISAGYRHRLQTIIQFR